MIKRAPMGNIRSYSDSVSRDPDPIILIQFVNGREPMAHRLWSHGLDRISHDFHPTVRVEIPTVTLGELITKYITPDGR